MVSALFTYGSLQLPAVMHAVTRRHFGSEPARLEGYARCRLRRRVYPGLRRRAGATTEGILYHGVDRLALSRLDRFEDEFYRRVLVWVVVEPGRMVLAHVYVISPQYYRLLEAGAWSLRTFQRQDLKRYLRRCRRRAPAACSGKRSPREPSASHVAPPAHQERSATCIESRLAVSVQRWCSGGSTLGAWRAKGRSFPAREDRLKWPRDEFQPAASLGEKVSVRA